MYIAEVRYLIHYDALRLMIAKENSFRTLELIQNEAVRIIYAYLNISDGIINRNTVSGMTMLRNEPLIINLYKCLEINANLNGL